MFSNSNRIIRDPKKSALIGDLSQVIRLTWMIQNSHHYHINIGAVPEVEPPVHHLVQLVI